MPGAAQKQPGAAQKQATSSQAAQEQLSSRILVQNVETRNPGLLGCLWLASGLLLAASGLLLGCSWLAPGLLLACSWAAWLLLVLAAAGWGPCTKCRN